MAKPRENERARSGRRLPLGAVCLVLSLAVLVTLPGCGGCRQDPAQAKKDREKEEAEKRAKKDEKPKPDFVVTPLATRPGSGKLAAGQDPLGPPYKPGHWTSTTLAAKTNNFDFVGDLEIVPIDRGGDAIPLESVPFRLTTTRQVSLPKRQPKVFESILFVPATDRQALVSCRLNWSKGGRRAWEGPHQRLSRMPSYQYHFVVLARWPERYTYLKQLASVKPPSDTFTSSLTEPYYRVSLMRADKATRRPLLPSYGLLWTSIACVLWDDAEPACLSLDQQQALLDWLHWGGQLILSGPDTLDTLRGGFLADYLPATASGVRKLAATDFQELNAWSNRNKSVPPLVPVGEWTGIQLKPHREARYMAGSGKLLLERRVGRGRIVVSAFRLSGRSLTTWPGWDEVFNAFVLERPRRRFEESRDLELLVNWADAPGRRLDAGRISKLRYFSRDTGVAFKTYGADVLRTDSDVAWSGIEEGSPPGPGVAAWNQSGPVARAARSALKSAAQIEIPDRSFVLWIVAGYLLVLVPANWAVFRLVGRVEWAWIAAPLIAVVCTIFVIRAAQLDIGFIRSRTEISVVELQPDYPRAHVTRYTALYTSLTTEYDFLFEDPGALVQPFPKVNRAGRFSDIRGLIYRRGKNASLQDYFVRSNSTGMVHSEHMIDLGGTLSLQETSGGRLQVVNQTELTLHDARVIKKGESGDIETAWIPRLEPGATASLQFSRRPVPPRSGWIQTTDPNRPVSGSRLWQQEGTDPSLTGIGLPQGEVSLRPLVELAQNIAGLEPGQMRLIAGLGEEIPGPTIDPPATQPRHAALVVAYLRYGLGEDPQPDVNLPPKRRPSKGSPEDAEPDGSPASESEGFDVSSQAPTP